MWTPAPGFDYEACKAQPSVPPPTSRISVGGIIFVMSQMHENTFVVQTIHFSNGCSSWKGIFFFFGVDFEMCNFVESYMPKHTD